MLFLPVFVLSSFQYGSCVVSDDDGNDGLLFGFQKAVARILGIGICSFLG